jgi:glutaconate CoA-transferase subunit B
MNPSDNPPSCCRGRSQKELPRERVLWGWWRRSTDGPKWIVTPKCIFDFDPDTLEARLARLFPGVTVDDIRANTGFEVKTTKNVETVAPPTKEGIEVLRKEVDKTGVLRN